jgi:hypothetical protein
MIKRIKKIINELRNNQKKIISLNEELIWANVFHDSIRGKVYLENLSLNIGRWAGNYTFFYILNRVLNDYQPKNILEFGLGESTKFISTYIENELLDSTHLIIEQEYSWKEQFENRFKLSSNSKIEVCPIEKKEVHNYDVNFYKDIESKINEPFDLYVIDGPLGSERFSRYDVVNIIKKTFLNEDFIILIDDFNRIGEKDTVTVLKKYFFDQSIKIYSTVFSGEKQVCVIATEKYKYLISI